MTPSKRAVFVVNKGFHDYSPAEAFGDLVFMSTTPTGISQYHTSTMARLFQPYVITSNADDYILVTAYTVMVSVASAMFAAKHRRLNLLIYKASDNSYEVRRLVFDREDNKKKEKN